MAAEFIKILDTNGDGLLSRRELTVLMKKEFPSTENPEEDE